MLFLASNNFFKPKAPILITSYSLSIQIVKHYEELEDIQFTQAERKCTHMIILVKKHKQQQQIQEQEDPKNMMHIQNTLISMTGSTSKLLLYEDVRVCPLNTSAQLCCALIVRYGFGYCPISN